ncbi:MAG TPA: CHRD domain-containing protein [Gemmatimonadales bacterium]|nr:CHRD domain-containing protein [Gemmatimonadales bacterium]
MRERKLVGLSIVLLAIMSCKDDVGITVSERFVANLSGANERPAITTTATGTATFTYLSDIGSIFYRLDVANIDSAFAAHIHGPAADTANAGVVVTLFSGQKGLGFTGTLAQGIVGEAGAPSGMTQDSLLVLLRNGQAYVNVHTKAHGGGEIRGQVVKQ